MIERLEYSLADAPEDDFRQSILRVAAPKRLIDYITSSQGPMFDETRLNAPQRSLVRVYDGSGGVILGFNLAMPRGDPESRLDDRARHIIKLVAQIDTVARRHEAGDPRLAMTLEPNKGLHSMSNDHLSITFDRPEKEDFYLAKRLQDLMVTTALFSRLHHTSQEDRDNIFVTFHAAEGLRIHTEGIGRPVLTQDGGASFDEDTTITLSGGLDEQYHYQGVAQSRLIALTAIIGTLNPL